MPDQILHYDFGENWKDYARSIDSIRTHEAERGVLKLLSRDEIENATWLDIGSGSGLHSLAAARLGASSITAIDLDQVSVETTRETLLSHHKKTSVQRMSVFEMEGLGKFDVVYSWGVLHHTGNMWLAIRAASNRVERGGYFVTAIYQRTPLCRIWKIEKWLYTKSPRYLRMLASAMYGSALLIAHAATGKNPRRYVANYKSARGMSYWHDVHDWLGGYPYESASPEEVVQKVSELGFEPVKVFPVKRRFGLFGTGCAEYVFRRVG